MPWFRVAQPLKRYSFKGPQEIFKVLLTRNVSVLSEQPTSEAGNPGNILQGDDAIPNDIELIPADGKLSPGSSVAIVVNVPPHHNSRITVKTEVTRTETSPEIDHFLDRHPVFVTTSATAATPPVTSWHRRSLSAVRSRLSSSSD